MRRLSLLCAVAAALVLGGCATRSISNAGYEDGDRYYGGRANPFYRGELTEFDVLGITLDKPVSNDEIARSATAYRRIAARKGEAILVMQSGAAIPDDPMVTALDRYFAVIPFSGVPVAGHEITAEKPTPVADIGTYGQALRLAAARSGADLIFCYWGALESATENEATKGISWLPVVGGVIPDQTQHMRIRLKVAVIDVKTGSWATFVPPPFIDSALSNADNRAVSDQIQVQKLKEQAYKAAVDAFVEKYAG
jgi:hypothetical protein